MSDTPPEILTRNRLDGEASPYLQQHADNPVNWQPWAPATLRGARETDRPIFLSVGYSSCHWCHVMAEESFENEDIASVLNEAFVSVKVDREERPDVDSIYMRICQLVRGQGGWPLTVFLTPDRRPFYVGTYFPPSASNGQTGFEQLCRDIAAAWQDEQERAKIERRAAQWTDALAGELEAPPEPAEGTTTGDDLLERAAEAAAQQIDPTHGGFGRSGPKFPNAPRLHLLLRGSTRQPDDPYEQAIRATLDGMADGGVYDQLGGGFHRYATDRSWTVPHFEKMLYDQAALTRVYLAGWQAYGDDRYARVAEESFRFVERELTHPEGGFYSTLDAQSEDPETGSRQEGAYWTWTPAQLETLDMDGAQRELFAAHVGITASGNFEEGRTVLRRERTAAELASTRPEATSEIESQLEELKEIARRARTDRPRPNRDEKILAGWNGLMIRAYTEGALVLDPALIEPAVAALEFCQEHLWDATTARLFRRWRDGDRGVAGYLEDYAALAHGALAVYQVTGEPERLSFALALGEALVEEFWDPESGTLYFTPQSGESLVVRPQETQDSSTPSATGLAASLLDALDRFRADDSFGEITQRLVASHRAEFDTESLSKTTLLLAADDHRQGVPEFTITATPLPERVRQGLGRAYLPGRLLAPRPATEAGLAEWLEELELDEVPPIWAGRAARDGELTIYTCRSRTCSPPVNDVGAALEWAEKLASS